LAPGPVAPEADLGLISAVGNHAMQRVARSEAGRRLPVGAEAIAPAAAILARQDVRSTEEPGGYDLGESEWGGGGAESKQTETEGGYGYEFGDGGWGGGVTETGEYGSGGATGESKQTETEGGYGYELDGGGLDSGGYGSGGGETTGESTPEGGYGYELGQDPLAAGGF
jgi:hypothetical protein